MVNLLDLKTGAVVLKQWQEWAQLGWRQRDDPGEQRVFVTSWNSAMSRRSFSQWTHANLPLWGPLEFYRTCVKGLSPSSCLQTAILVPCAGSRSQCYSLDWSHRKGAGNYSGLPSRGQDRCRWTVEISSPHLPSPPQSQLGVISTSRQLSIFVLYTYNFSSLPWYSSTMENRSSLWRKSTGGINPLLTFHSTEIPSLAWTGLYLVHQSVSSNNVVCLGSQTSQSCRGISFHFLDKGKYLSSQQSFIWSSLRFAYLKHAFYQNCALIWFYCMKLQESTRLSRNSN